jgi:hypothetical protein
VASHRAAAKLVMGLVRLYRSRSAQLSLCLLPVSASHSVAQCLLLQVQVWGLVGE